MDAVAHFLTLDPGGPLWVITFPILIILRLLFVARSALRYVFPRPRRRRRTTLSYHQRVRRLRSCIRSRSLRERKRPKRKSANQDLKSTNQTTPQLGRRPSLSTRRRHHLDYPEKRRWNSHRASLPQSLFDSFIKSIDPLLYLKAPRCSLLSKTLPSVFYFTSNRPFIPLSAHQHGHTPPSPTCDHTETTQSFEVPIIIDTGASFSVTPMLSDFVSDIQPSPIGSLQSLDAPIQVHGKGTIEWEVQDKNGTVRTIRTNALYIPTASVRLFSPQCYFDEHDLAQLHCSKQLVVLTLHDGSTLEFPWTQPCNLPHMLTSKLYAEVHGKPEHGILLSQSTFPAVLGNDPLPNVLDQSNLNLTGSQKELLLWHQRLGHCALKTVQQLLAIPRDEFSSQILIPQNRRASTCDLPRCNACQYAKQKRRSSTTAVHRPVIEREGGISNNVLSPGQKVSADLYQSTIPGRLPHTKGQESETSKYSGGAIFYDIASKLVFVRHQTNLTAAMTVDSKHALERYADEFGIKIQEYLTDNHPFRAQEFVQDCVNSGQKQSLSGVGAHHQNRVERASQTIFNWSRAMLLHYILHWPQEARLELWPYAVDYAVWLWNHIPDASTRLSPIEVFTSTTFPDFKHLQRTRVFGCPVFVLDPKLQDAKKLPKWQRRSWKGIFLGFSTQHHTTVALVLNPTTGSITPQYHVIYDEKFSTITNTPDDAVNVEQWDDLLSTGHEQYEEIEDTTIPEDLNQWTVPADTIQDIPRVPPQVPSRTSISNEAVEQRENTPARTPMIKTEAPPTPTIDLTQDDDDVAPATSPIQTQEPTPGIRRSGRTRQMPSHLSDFVLDYAKPLSGMMAALTKQTRFSHFNNLPRTRGEVLNQQRLATLQWDDLKTSLVSGAYGSMLSELRRNTVDGFIEEWNPMLLATKANAEDHPTYEEAMNGPYAAGFKKAFEIEIQTLIDKKCWDVVDRPTDQHVVSSTWALRIKRFPDGAMRKLKARFCARGFEQIEGIDYNETYAPVVNWTTVRFLLTMSILLGLETKQVDYVAAFVQSEIDTKVYVEMPRGFGQPGKVLKLRKSLYGLTQSPRNFFQHLQTRLHAIGFQSCDADPCLFVSDKCIILVYVDDTLLFARTKQDIDDVIADLRKQDLDLEEEDDVAGFLGILIDRRPDGSIVLLQEGLIQRVIDALHIDHLPNKRTPAQLGVLSTDPEGDPPNAHFNYASVLGMLGYLQANSRPDITFAVSQCARFSHSPKRSHEQALERIGQYLKGTKNKGLIYRPKTLDDIFTTDVYVDADFAGGWGYEDPNDPTSVKSRTGFIIEVMGCPVQWMSKLQTNIATSTMEAEYTALSIALRSAIPLIDIIQYVTSSFLNTPSSVLTFKTTVHEDNQGALKLAQMEPGRTTPRSKFYAIKYHWFRSWLKPKEIELQYIESAQQKADMLTKSLPTDVFELNRFLSCGW